MAKLRRRIGLEESFGSRLFVLLVAVVLVATACSSSSDGTSGLEVPADDSIPTTTQDPADPYRRVAGGVVLIDADGFLQLCFRLVDQDGEVLCADARATFGPDDYTSFDGSKVGTEEVDGLTLSSDAAWLYEAEFDDGVRLELRPAGLGEVIQ